LGRNLPAGLLYQLEQCRRIDLKDSRCLFLGTSLDRDQQERLTRLGRHLVEMFRREDAPHRIRGAIVAASEFQIVKSDCAGRFEKGMRKRRAPQAQPYVNVALATKSTVRLGADIKARIGQQLRAMYSDVVDQGVPDRFSEILCRLDQADEAGTDRKNENWESNGLPG
jgi:Anti-sigma factor NepR